MSKFSFLPDSFCYCVNLFYIQHFIIVSCCMRTSAPLWWHILNLKDRCVDLAHNCNIHLLLKDGLVKDGCLCPYPALTHFTQRVHHYRGTQRPAASVFKRRQTWGRKSKVAMIHVSRDGGHEELSQNVSHSTSDKFACKFRFHIKDNGKNVTHWILSFNQGETFSASTHSDRYSLHKSKNTRWHISNNMTNKSCWKSL